MDPVDAPSNHPILAQYADKLEPQILSQLLTYDCYWNWIRYELNDKEVQLISKRYSDDKSDDDDSDSLEGDSNTTSRVLSLSKLELRQDLMDKEDPTEGETADRDSISSESMLNFKSAIDYSQDIDSASNSCKKIFWLTYLQRYGEARVLLNELRNKFTDTVKKAEEACALIPEGRLQELQIDHCLLSNPEVSNVFKYVFDGLEAFLALRVGDYKYVKSLISDKPNSQQLPVKWQVILNKLKLGFWGDNRKYSVQIMETFRKLMELNPKYSSWCRGFHFYARILRRQKALNSDPGEKETEAAVKAYTISPEDPLNIAVLCLNMSEILRKVLDKRERFPVSYGNSTYKSPEEMVECIKKKAREVMDKAAKLDHQPFIDLNAVFSTSLPYKYRDLDLAEECLNCALEICPDSIVATHRKALLIMKKNPSSTKARAEATDILKAIVELGSLWFYPLYDYINILLVDVENNRSELETLFSQNLNKTESWSPPEISKLNFLRGCFNFLVKSYQEAFQDWINALSLDSETDHFEGLQLAVKRFHWNPVVNIAKIYEELMKLGKRSFDEKHWSTVDLFMEKLKNLKSANTSIGSNQREWHGPLDQYQRKRTSSEQNDRRVTESESELSWRAGAGTGNEWTPAMSSVVGSGRGFGVGRGNNDGRTRTRSSNSTSKADCDDNWRRK